MLGYHPDSGTTKGKHRTRYEYSPRKCINCGESIQYNKRANMFCSRQCSSAYNGRLRSGAKGKGMCAFCGTSLNNAASTYCSIKCHKQHVFVQNLNNWLFVDSDVDSRRAKDYIKHLFGYKCACCGISEWQGDKITLELEHVDGNHKNNCISNLKLLCPNCHSQTHTYKARNKGNGRASRRLRYQQGKSY